MDITTSIMSHVLYEEFTTTAPTAGGLPYISSSKETSESRTNEEITLLEVRPKLGGTLHFAWTVSSGKKNNTVVYNLYQGDTVVYTYSEKITSTASSAGTSTEISVVPFSTYRMTVTCSAGGEYEQNKITAGVYGYVQPITKMYIEEVTSDE